MRMRKQAQFSERFDRRWTGYAAAGAAGVGMLMNPVAGHAHIVYTSTNQVLTSGSLTIALDGTNDFQFTDSWGGRPGKRPPEGTISVFIRNLRVSGLGQSGNQVGMHGSYVAALKRGALIGPGAPFKGGTNIMGGEVLITGGFTNTSHGFGTHYPFGPWPNNGQRYAGLQFEINGQIHYGWAVWTIATGVANGEPYVDAILQGYAYETVAGQALRAGAGEPTGADVGQAPKQGTLGQLALGSLGLGFWRKKPDGEQ